MNEQNNVNNYYISFNNRTIVNEKECFNNEKLLTANLFPNIEVISTLAFGNCYNLRHFYVSDSLKSIESLAFLNCYSLKEIYVPKDCYIKNNAFDGTNNLTIKYGGSVEYIYKYFDSSYIEDYELGILQIKFDSTPIISEYKNLREEAMDLLDVIKIEKYVTSNNNSDAGYQRSR